MTSDDRFLIAIATCIIAAIVAGIQYLNFQRERLNQKIAAAKWQNDFFTEFRKWSDEAMLQLSEAMHLCERGTGEIDLTTLTDARYTLRIKLSAQIDRGRWFFPNHESSHGPNKPAAFQGYRHEVLNGLVSAYKALSRLEFTADADNRVQRQAIAAAKREFTGEIQKILAPRSRNEEFRRLIGVVTGQRTPDA